MVKSIKNSSEILYLVKEIIFILKTLKEIIFYLNFNRYSVSINGEFKSVVKRSKNGSILKVNRLNDQG